MGFSTLTPDMRRLGPRRWLLREPLTFTLECFGVLIRVTADAGFESDLASTPRPLWWLYSPDGSYTLPSILHDWLYRRTRLPRLLCDVLFLVMMAETTPMVRRHVIYRGVRTFGWLFRQRCAKQCFLALIACLLVVSGATGMDAGEPGFAMLPSPAELARFRNLDGSCAWCSVGLLGIHAGMDIGYIGRGGAIFLDVERAIQRRNLPMRVVRSRDGFLAIEAALKRGQWAAMTWQVGDGGTPCRNCGRRHGGLHMLNVVGVSSDGQRWAILDNNRLDRLLIVTRDRAWNEYNAGGAWGVVMEAKR